jgi:hypothetical protein
VEKVQQIEGDVAIKLKQSPASFGLFSTPVKPIAVIVACQATPIPPPRFSPYFSLEPLAPLNYARGFDSKLPFGKPFPSCFEFLCSLIVRRKATSKGEKQQELIVFGFLFER